MLAPWSNWVLATGPVNPDWRRSYNNVKHERHAYFHEATLRNAVDSMAALLIVVYLHKKELMTTGGVVADPRKSQELSIQTQASYFCGRIITGTLWWCERSAVTPYIRTLCAGLRA